MKLDRQAMILEIIAQENIETQEQLLTRLQARGLRCTQATISRDIKQLHLVKEPAGQGVYKYAVSGNRTTLNVAAKLRTIFRECIVSIDYAQNIVVVKTMPGLANGACSALDNMDMNDIVGSLAGDDTALLVMRNTEAAELLCQEIKDMLKRPGNPPCPFENWGRGRFAALQAPPPLAGAGGWSMGAFVPPGGALACQHKHDLKWRK